MHKLSNLNKAALFIALLFHVSGLIGILFTPYKDWFIKGTIINLLLMALLLIITHHQKNKKLLYCFLITFITGFVIEVLGVHTGFIFGNYSYGSVLGAKLFDVPLMIGLNWFIIIYCTGMFTKAYENYMLKKLDASGFAISRQLQTISFIVDGALLALMFDWIMEPVAVKLGFWQWQNGNIPLFNYISWIITSALLLALFKKLNTGKRNIFAVHLFLIQLLFFLVLRTFL